MKITNKLKNIREENNFTQKKVAELLNITVRQYINIEKQTPKSVTQFYKLAKIFNTTIDNLLEQGVNPSPK